jgi:P-type conjugative transfer protein TrbJ
MNRRDVMIGGALAPFFAAVSLPARAGGAAGMATEMTQLANNAELVAIYAENVAQLQQMIQQYTNMLQNTLSLPQQMWSSVLVPISDLIDTIASVDSAANASATALTQFANQYQYNGALGYANEINRWRSGVKNQIAHSLRAAGLNADKIKDRASAMQELMALSQSAQGRMQVLQAGNQIAGLMVNELQSLHTTMIAAEQSRQNYLATEIREKEEQEEAVKRFFTAPGRRL